MNANDILNNLGAKQFSGIALYLTSLLKFPVIVLLFGNVLFAALLFFRIRILADTFESSQNSFVKAIISIYLAITIVGSIMAVLFLLIG